jgi:hypothetical protein
VARFSGRAEAGPAALTTTAAAPAASTAVPNAKRGGNLIRPFSFSE